MGSPTGRPIDPYNAEAYVMVRNFLKWMVFGLVMGGGCVVQTNVSRSPYEDCGGGDSCSGATICQAVGLSAFGVTGNLCTTGCVTNADCPPGLSGFTAVCVATSSTGGQCYDQCPSGSSLSCPGATSCRSVVDSFDGTTFNICVP